MNISPELNKFIWNIDMSQLNFNNKGEYSIKYDFRNRFQL